MISVVVAGIAEGELGLKETLKSVLTQDYPDFHCVAVTPRRPDLDSPRLDWIEGSGLQAGIAQAQGDLVAFLAPGDILMPGALSIMVEALGSQLDVAGWYSDQLLLDGHGVVIGEQREERLDLQQHLRREGPSVSSLLCLRREALAGLGAELTGAYALWLRAAREGPLLHSRVFNVARRARQRNGDDYLQTTLDFLASSSKLQDRESLANVYFWASKLTDRTSWKRWRYLAKLGLNVYPGLVFSKRSSRALLLLAERWWPISQLHQSLRLYFETNPYKGKHYSLIAPDLLEG